MTAISSIIEAHASEVTHTAEAQNVTVRQRPEAPPQRFAPNADLKPGKLFITTSPYQYQVWKKSFTVYLESGTLNGQLPNDMVAYNFLLSFCESKLLPLVEVDLSKNSPLLNNLMVLEKFYNTQKPLYARVEAVITHRQDGGGVR